MLNKVFLIGRIGNELELKQSQSGLAFLNLSLATVEKYKEQEKTEWHRVILFGKSAENTAKYCGKGSLVFVEGKIQTSKYEKNGQTHFSTEIVADTIRFLNNRNATSQSQSAQTQPQTQQASSYDNMDEVPW